MKKVLLFVTLIIGSSSFGQTIMVNGSPYLATQNNSFPFWLDAGSTLSTNPPMNFISVVEYNENEYGDDTNLGYSKVLSITESSVVPDGKVWKVISALQYHYEGCTDETMFNYDPQANVDDGSCEPIIVGCTNINSWNYNPDANTNDSCIPYVYGCMDILACNYLPNADNDNGDCEYPDPGFLCDGSNLEVGYIGYGGIVFYIDLVENYALISSLEDFTSNEWGCLNQSVLGAMETSIGSGLQNTEIILDNCDQRPIAASIVFEYEYDGYSDWYLPSKDELYIIYDSISSNYQDIWYWSSSEISSGKAWGLNFGSGITQENDKHASDNAIAIRRHNL